MSFINQGAARTGRVRAAGHAGTLAAACIAVFVAQLANAMPVSLNGLFSQDLGAVGADLTWISAAFQVTVVVFEFTFGALGDLFGRRRLVVIGAVLLAIGASVCAMAPSVEWLWVGAAINGLGAGAMYPGSLALIAAISRTPEARARAVALWAGMLGAAAVVAPTFGGLFAKAGSWQTPFWMLAGLSLVAAVLIHVLSQESAAPEGRKLDIPGQFTFAIGLLLVMFAAVQGSEDGWGEWYVVGGFVVGTLFLLAFIAVERKAESPILDLGLFRNRAFAVTSLVSVIGMFAFLAAAFSTSIWISAIQHQDPMKVAFAFLFLQGPAFFLYPLITKLLRFVSPVWLLSVGFVLIGVGSLLCLNLDVDDRSMSSFVLPCLLIGLGFAATVASFTAVALNSVPLHLAGMASATTNMLRDLGFALGPVIAGAVALSHAKGLLVSGLEPIAAQLPPEQAGPLMGLASEGGAMAANNVLEPGSPPQQLAMHALESGFHQAWLVAGIAAFAAAAITVVGLFGVKHADEPIPGALDDPLHPEPV